ncbi:MAG: PilZ domain-containing protein [Kiritimatiellae bacterium]|nr:PilZ domain-containing protein [Kiritimatiellia bacterium]
MLEALIRFQEEDGQVPDLVEIGEDVTGPTDKSGRPMLVRLAKRSQSGMDQEAALIIAVSSYVHHSGDVQFLSKNIHGNKVAKHLYDAMEYLWQSRFSESKGLLLSVKGEEAAEVVAGIVEHAWVLCAIDEMLGLPGISGLAQKTWRLRQRGLAANIHNLLWNEVQGKYLPVPTGDETREDAEFDPRGAALAIRAGLLNSDESGRSLRATQILLEEQGPRAGWAALAAAIYEKAGYQVQAMEMLRGLAECLRDGDLGGGESCESACSLFSSSEHLIAAYFLEAMKNLHPMVQHAPPPQREETSPMLSFGYPSMRKFSFRKIEYEEKRENKRAPIELPVDILVKGLRHRQKATGVIRHPSTYGLGLITTEAIAEGATLEMTAHCELLGSKKPCRLRGRVSWTRSKVGTRLYQSGVELDARSKDLKKWKSFVLKHLRMQDALQR